jgi:hypothetical protein
VDALIAEPWLLLLYPLFFVAIWIGICVAVAMLAGWPTLAQRFRATGSPAGQMFFFASGSMRTGFLPIGYRNCLTVTVGEAGVRIRMLFLLRVMHAPLLIPWSAIDLVTRQAGAFGRKGAVIAIRDFDRRLVLYGKAAEKVATTFDKLKGSASLDGGRRSRPLALTAARPLA